MSFIDTPDFDENARGRDNAVPEFSLEPVLNNFKSGAEGRPVYDEFEMVTIRVPGDRKTEWYGRVTDAHRKRFPQAYAAFKAQMEAPTEGTPLSEWPGVTRGQVHELTFSHVKTVEQLADLPDDLLNKAMPMGGYALRDKARRYLKSIEGSAPMEALAAENENLKATIQTQQQQLDDLRKAVDALQAKRGE